MSTDTPTLPTQRRCLGCGVNLRIIDRFCYNCGQQAEQASPSPASSQETLIAVDVPPPVVPGEVFADRFRVKKELGAGGMGIVYLVEEIGSSLEMALKILKPEFVRDTAARVRFEREVRILARIRHPSIPRIFEWGSHHDFVFFVTEVIEGNDLGVLIKERGKLPYREAVPIAVKVTEALKGAHQAGIVHRDLKPANIMTTPEGSIFLIDFGVARSTMAELTQLTETGLFMGTPQYMSPEQLDSKRADERSDIYSLGVVLFELLTGRLPFDGDTPMAIATKHLQEYPPAPRSVVPDLPFWLDKIVLRCLEKDPMNRFFTANEILTEFKKSHARARIKKREMQNGDTVTEDPSQRNGCCLTIHSMTARDDWDASTTIYYKDQFYKVMWSKPPAADQSRWVYGFDFWPDHEIMRRVIDYESDAAVHKPKGSILSQARKWIGG